MSSPLVANINEIENCVVRHLPTARGIRASDARSSTHPARHDGMKDIVGHRRHG